VPDGRYRLPGSDGGGAAGGGEVRGSAGACGGGDAGCDGDGWDGEVGRGWERRWDGAFAGGGPPCGSFAGGVAGWVEAPLCDGAGRGVS